MQSRLGFRYFCFLFATIIAFCQISPAWAQNFRAGASFWYPPKNTSQCRSSFAGIQPFQLTPTLKRSSVWEQDDGPHFTAHYSMLLSETIAGRNVSKNKAYLLQVAGANTYTKAVFDGGWSPIYVQSNIIRMTAMYITVMQQRGQLSPEERKVFVDWCDRMIPGQKGSQGNKSADSQMMSGVAMISWGNIKGDNRLMKTGYRKFMSGYKFVPENVGKLRRHPSHRSVPVSTLSLEDEYSIALAHAVEGAAILRNLGLDITYQKYGGRNLHDAVAWWADVMLSAPPQFKGNKAWGHNSHIGWIPIYRHMFPNDPAISKLNARASKVTSGRSPSFRAVSLGGATDCLW